MTTHDVAFLLLLLALSVFIGAACVTGVFAYREIKLAWRRRGIGKITRELQRSVGHPR